MATATVPVEIHAERTRMALAEAGYPDTPVRVVQQRGGSFVGITITGGSRQLPMKEAWRAMAVALGPLGGPLPCWACHQRNAGPTCRATLSLLEDCGARQ